MNEGSECITVTTLCQFLINLTAVDDKELYQFKNVLQHFISNQNADSIIVMKCIDESINIFVNFPSIQEIRKQVSNAIILVKSKGALTTQKSLAHQLNILNVPIDIDQIDDQLDQLRLTINSGLSPYFDFITSSNEDLSSALAKKKFNELSLSLQHLQQRIQVPDLLITTHPQIKESISKGLDVITLDDSTLLNELGVIVNGWIKQIQSVTKLNHNPLDGDTITEDIQFWQSMDDALSALQSQVNSQEIKKTIDLLNKAKRFHITMSFQNDTEFENKIKQTKQINAFYKELPIEDLISTVGDNAEFEKFSNAIKNVFAHLKGKLTMLPLSKAIEITEVVIDDITRNFQALIANFELMALPHDEFLNLCSACDNTFFNIEQNIKYLINVLREMLRKSQAKFRVIEINQNSFDNLRARIHQLQIFKKNHENLILNVDSVLQDPKLTHELNDAYNKHVFSFNVLDVSHQGSIIWKMNEKEYYKTYDLVNRLLIERINSFFDQAESFNDLFAIYQTSFKSNASLRLSITDDYKSKIFTIIFKELQILIEVQTASDNTLFEDIVWKTSLNAKIKSFTDLMENLIGNDWQGYSVGNKISSLIAGLGQNINPEVQFRQFIQNLSSPSVNTLGPVIKVFGSAQSCDIILNFDFEFMKINQQLEQLSNLGFQIPSTYKLEYSKIDQLQKYATSLNDQIKTLKELFEVKFTGGFHDVAKVLLFDQLQIIGKHLEQLASVDWIYLLQADDLQQLNEPSLSEDLIEFQSLKKVSQFDDCMNDLSNSMLKLEIFFDSIDDLYHDLKSVKYKFESFQIIIKNIQQKFIDICLVDFNSSANLADLINEKVAVILNDRLKTQLFLFNTRISGSSDTIEVLELDKYDLNFTQVTHNIQLSEEFFVVKPNFAEGKKRMFEYVNSLVLLVERQQSIKMITAKADTQKIITEIIQAELCKSIDNIEELYEKAERYVDEWNYLQRLWETDFTDKFEALEIFQDDKSIVQWFESIERALKLKQLFDLPEPRKVFGDVLIIDFSQVQNKASVKFERMKRNLLAHFATKLDLDMKHLESILFRFKNYLEDPIQFATSSDKMIKNIDKYLECKSSLKDWSDHIEQFKQIQFFLTLQKFKYPPDWLYVEQLENILLILRSLLDRKGILVEENQILLVSKINSESIKLDESINILLEAWEEKKPIAGNITPSTALLSLRKFRTNFSEAREYANSIRSVAQSINVDISAINFDHVLDEIGDLESVWGSLNQSWTNLENLKQMKWRSLEPRQLYHQLNDLMVALRALPSNVKRYAAVNEMQNYVQTQLKNQLKISELKSDFMKPRHWKILMSQLNIPNIDIDQLQVVDVWDLNILSNLQAIESILEQARNERTLEDSLSSIGSTWSVIGFELFNHENKCKLVKNWDVLFDQCDTDLSSLASMRNSPYFSTFEKNISELENKLDSLFLILDAWIEVQRQWVYLEGVFGNKYNDLKVLLPIESSRFTNISFEFINLCKRIFKFDLVIDIIIIHDLQRIMTRYSESLIKIRKSLSDYLEQQRELFPRFYFIGDEDLLEILGSSREMTSINKHLKKLFSGVDRIKYEKEVSSIVGLVSTEGETLKLSNPVSLIKHPMVHDWLKILELEIKLTLSSLVLHHLSTEKDKTNFDELIQDLKTLPAQVVTISSQINFTSKVESSDPNLSKQLTATIDFLTNYIKHDLPDLLRKKIQYVLIEIIHQKTLMEELTGGISIWNLQQRFYLDTTSTDSLKMLRIKQANVELFYGWEYLGIPGKLAYTPLINKCYLAMSLALGMKLGGSPFGPAGTGKTETIKALGHNLGKMVMVFNCDQSFDYQSMSRIFLGLCKVGNWGCFDEFNRLDEKSLSAISSQIEFIELALKNSSNKVTLLNQDVTVHPETGLFVTMNPGYAGRSELPENLKKLFRSFSMSKPDSEIIVDILLKSKGFKYSSALSKVIVPFYHELSTTVSNQTHYDFGLRALKNMLNRCDELIQNTDDDEMVEKRLIFESINATIAPKLVKHDESIYSELRNKYFVDVLYQIGHEQLVIELERCFESDGIESDDNLIKKCLQLYEIQKSHHGIILIGQPGSGKSTISRIFMKALSVIEDSEYSSIVIDAKILTSAEVFGKLDPITKEWTDGLFTSVLRKIRDNLRNESDKQIWIVFDGDVDPLWAENLNSVLDDNKILTLATGERIGLPENVRIVFEVDNLKHATPATISRCGIVWFDSSLASIENCRGKMIHNLTTLDFAEDNVSIYQIKQIHVGFVEELKLIVSNELLQDLDNLARGIDHIMIYTFVRAIQSLETQVRTFLRRLINQKGTSDVKLYTAKSILLSLIWSFAGDAPLEHKNQFAKTVCEREEFVHLNVVDNIVDYDISSKDCDWVSWANKVPMTELEPYEVANSNTVVSTLDTVKHEHLVYSIVNEHKSLILCGPPGSGKTMTLLEALRKSPSLELIALNFSKETTPSSLLKALEQFCIYKKTNKGYQLAPATHGKWVVVFCDEMNLPKMDNYDSQNVIALMRQMIERNGFWRTKDMQWISLENIQFVGACNPSTVPGRNILSNRFLRHVSLIMVDYPGRISLQQIYQTFINAILKCAPNLRGFAKDITNASIEVYQRNRFHFSNKHPHYVYSPRELTRWTKGLLEALKSKEYHSLDELLRLWYHEGLRLFYDRLVSKDDKSLELQIFHDVATEHFPTIDLNRCFRKPILFSDWMDTVYKSVDEIDLQAFVSERLKVFSEEVLEVDLVLHEEMLDYVLRIDRVLRQQQGHMILVGPSASGRSTLSKFVAWINGLKIEQLNVYSNYTLNDFDDTLKRLLLRCCDGEKICFIIDESAIIETSFVERMNTLLANAEIPGLFIGEEYTNLMSKCSENSHRQGFLLDTDAELYSWFTQQVSSNLHVIFNIDDSNDSADHSVMTSPALFNRCVLSWMSDWSNNTLKEIASFELDSVPLDDSNYNIPQSFGTFLNEPVANFRDVILDILVFTHRHAPESNATVKIKRAPNHFLTLIKLFVKLFTKKQIELEESQRHIIVGLDKIHDTVIQVDKLKKELAFKEHELKVKDEEARKMLNRMLVDQNEAERKQEFSVVTQAELEKQEKEIKRRREVVMKDLEYAEPAVLEAQRGVQNIKKQHLTEIRSMSNPPAAVKMTMESVCILLGYEVSSWRDVQLVIRKDDFIPNIVSFDGEVQISTSLRDYMEKHYLMRDDYTFEVVHRASKACGPLLQWVRAQLAYSKILDNIGPLRQEVQSLEQHRIRTKAQLIAIDEMIQELEESIEKYKEDYSQVIRDSENIKSEMKLVHDKVERSMNLVSNLKSEKERWRASIDDFSAQKDKLVGDALLAAAFITYCGPLDQMGREALMQCWKLKLQNADIKFDKMTCINHYLEDSYTNPKWSSLVQNDELYIDNLALINWSNFPLIIDPNGEIIDTIAKHLKHVTLTSFLNDGLIGQLENSLRFGGTIIIQDCEHYNPIIDCILKQEIQRNGGRMMMKLGEELIDYSPNFKLIMSTKESQIELSSFIMSRATIVNFTITPGSLMNKSLDIILKKIKPDADKQRVEINLLHGEYKIRLQNLEVDLLNSLNGSVGNILNNDEVLEKLVFIKAEANKIKDQLSQSSNVVSIVEETRDYYKDFAKQVSTLYTIIETFAKLSRFYSVSLTQFVLNFTEVFEKNCKKKPSDLILDLYKEFYAIVVCSAKFEDKVVLTLLFFLAYYDERIEAAFGSTFKNLVSSILTGDLSQVLKSCNAKVETEWNLSKTIELNKDNTTLQLLSNLLLDPTKDLVRNFAHIGSIFFEIPFESKYDLTHWVDKFKILLFTSPDDYDATYKVIQLASLRDIRLVHVPMGSKEGVEAANREIETSSIKPQWVVFQNIQMSPSWYSQLEKKLSNLSLHDGSRIIITCSTNTKLQTGLISQSKVLNFDGQNGLKAIFADTYKLIPKEMLTDKFRHITFLLTWYHSLIMERLRYAPISFKKRYDINDSDFIFSLQIIKDIHEKWEEIKYLVASVIYGSKVDVEDLSYFVQLSENLFTKDSMNFDFTLVDDLTIPKRSIDDWIQNLPNETPVAWLELNSNADKLLNEQMTKNIAHKFIKLTAA